MLRNGTVPRPSMSQYLPTSWPSSQKKSSNSSMSAYSTCSSGGEVFSSSESDEFETDESAGIEEEGESKLTLSESTKTLQLINHI